MVFDVGMLASSSYDLVQEGMIVPFQERRAAFPRRMTSGTDERLLEHIKEMMLLSKHKPAGYEAAIKGHLFLMLFQAASFGRLANRSRSEAADMTRTERLKKVILYIQSHYHRPIRLSELADLIPMSEGQFCRFFKSMTGQTPVDYIIPIAFARRRSSFVRRTIKYPTSHSMSDLGTSVILFGYSAKS